jgi:hypothetical protein
MMSNIEITCDEVTISKSPIVRDEVTVLLCGIRDDDILNEFKKDDIASYASDNCLSEVIDYSDDSEVLSEFSWDDVKAHFITEIIDELAGLEDTVLEEIGWSVVKEHFADNIDALATEIAHDMVERGVE